jgi:hypothetical protein
LLLLGYTLSVSISNVFIKPQIHSRDKTPPIIPIHKKLSPEIELDTAMIEDISKKVVHINI